MSASGLWRRPVTLVWLPHAALSVVGIHTFYAVPVADFKSLVAFRVIATGSVAYRPASFRRLSLNCSEQFPVTTKLATQSASEGVACVTIRRHLTRHIRTRLRKSVTIKRLQEPQSLPRCCFPRHEIIERSSSFIHNKFDDICIID